MGVPVRGAAPEVLTGFVPRRDEKPVLLYDPAIFCKELFGHKPKLLKVKEATLD